MLHKTRGIVLHSIKYSDTSNIVKIYTEAFGLQSYLVRGVRKARSKTKAGQFQHLSLLDLIVYQKEKKEIQNLKEVRSNYLFQSIPFDIVKSSLALFINELLYKSIREEEANPELFEFLYESVKSLDRMENSPVNFHLIFALKLTKYLGFFPHGSFDQERQFFDLHEGVFQSEQPAHADFLRPPISEHFDHFLQSEYEFSDKIRISNAIRQEVLNAILLYYQAHIPGFKAMKSVEVLHTVLG